MLKRVAIIDIGTNTFNLLIVDRGDSDYKNVYSERIGVGLGHGGINSSIIAPAAFKRGLDCLKKYADTCSTHQVTSIFAFGTSALRAAENSDKFISETEKLTNIKIEILSGQAEANLIYKGINLGYDFKQKSVVMDIGGGSTEFILADTNGVIEKHSFEIGASRINQLFDFGESFTNKDVLKIENYLEEKIGNLLNGFSTDILVGSSGSFETFYELAHQKPYPAHEYHRVDLGLMIETLDQIIKSSLTERKNNPLIIQIRQEMLPIAAIKTKWALRKMNCKMVIISPYSLKEGAIFNR